MKPILFNTEMVRAILEGRKTVTRRIIKPHLKSKYKYKLGFIVDSTDKKQEGCYAFGISELGGRMKCVKPPYKVGDVLYVRETWRWLPCFECGRDMWAVPCREGKFNHTYKKNGCYVFKTDIHNCDADNLKWKPSIHMPKEAARIFLRVTGVRVERLHDMKLVDYLAEGISNPCDTCKRFPFDECDTCGREGTIGLRFAALWDSTIKADREHYAYTANPYVWVIEFEKLDVNNIKDAMAAEEGANG